MNEHGTNILIAAESWWLGLRPINWTEAQHIENPTVNTTTDNEKALAKSIGDAMADFVKAKANES